jgi:hypothetical protein
MDASIGLKCVCKVSPRAAKILRYRAHAPLPLTLPSRSPQTATDRVLGATLLLASIAIFVYFTAWSLVTVRRGGRGGEEGTANRELNFACEPRRTGPGRFLAPLFLARVYLR